MSNHSLSFTITGVLQNMMPKDAIIVSEGANTMDIGRTMLMNSLPKHRWQVYEIQQIHNNVT